MEQDVYEGKVVGEIRRFIDYQIDEEVFRLLGGDAVQRQRGFNNQ